MRIRVLGPLEVQCDGSPRPVAGARLQRLLVRLSVVAGRVVPATALIDAVWPDGPPAEAANALQSLVSRARRALGDPEVIVATGAGYRLVVPAEAVDLARFEALAARGHALLAEDPAGALDPLETALALWRGTALAEAGDAGWARALSLRLAEQRAGAVADRASALVATGRAGEAVAPLQELVRAHPLREPYAVALMTALQAAGRGADALGAYEALRRRLSAELGTEPGPAARAGHLRLLREPADRPVPDRRPPSNLRTAATPLVGRADELARARSLLAQGRLVTFIGPGGAGKTRLAVEVGRELRDGFPDGVWLVELAAVGDPDDVVQTLLSTLGARESTLLERPAGRDPWSRVLDILGPASCLLVVDNCEHLVAAVADLVDTVLGRCPGVRILATSREPLAVTGEALCAVPPLALPPAGVGPQEALDFPAVRLLAERAAAVSADFRVDEATVADVVAVVRRLDGMPLAIELAAARLRLLPISEVAQRLSDRFRLLSGGPRTALPRHRTLRAVVEWSWDLLDGPERDLLERLGVFAAGADTEAAVAVCADARLPAADVPDLLLSLADKSLLHVLTGPRVRFRLLETIREYALERLAEQGGAPVRRAAHAAWVLAEVERWDAELRGGDQAGALVHLADLAEEIAAAVRHLTDAGDHDGALRLVVGLSWYWTVSGADDQAGTLLDAVLTATAGSTHPVRPYARAAALVTGGAGDPVTGSADAVQLQVRALVAEMLATPLPSEACAVVRAWAAVISNDPDLAERVLSDGQGLDGPWGRATRHAMQAAMAENAGDVARTRREVDRAVEGFLAVGDRWGRATMVANRAVLRTYDGDLDGAEADLQAAREDLAGLGSSDDEAMIVLRLSDLRARRGDAAGAADVVAGYRAQVGARPRRFVGLLLEIAELGLDLATGALESATARGEVLRRRLRDADRDILVSGRIGAIILGQTAETAARVGDRRTARVDIAEAVARARGAGDLPIAAAVAGAAAWVALGGGDPAAAARLLGRADVLRGALDPTEVRTAAVWSRLTAADPVSAERARAVGRAESPPDALAHLAPDHW